MEHKIRSHQREIRSFHRPLCFSVLKTLDDQFDGFKEVGIKLVITFEMK